MKVDSLENIPEKVLDALAEKYGDNPAYRVTDERANISLGKRREYFLISNDGRTRKGFGAEWTFIWIDNGLWQFRYLNTQPNKARWVNPLELLNSLL